MGAPKGNKFAIGNNGGRPPIFKEPKELETKCLEYFEECIANKDKPTITGLTLFVGFCHRSSWEEYVNKNEFSYIVKRAKTTVENSYETSASTFDIFALKNMGWKDKTETDINTTESVQDLSNLSDSEILNLSRLQTKAKG